MTTRTISRVALLLLKLFIINDINFIQHVIIINTLLYTVILFAITTSMITFNSLESYTNCMFKNWKEREKSGPTEKNRPYKSYSHTVDVERNWRIFTKKSIFYFNNSREKKSHFFQTDKRVGGHFDL